MDKIQLHKINDTSIDIELDLMTIKYNGGNTGWFSPVYACKNYSQAVNYKWQCPIVDGQNVRERAQDNPTWAMDLFCDSNGLSQGEDRANRLTSYGCTYKGGLAGWPLAAQDDASCSIEGGDGQDFCCPHWDCPGDCGSQYGIIDNGCESCNCGDPEYGCMDSSACNYNQYAQVEYSPSDCSYAAFCHNCAGNCTCNVDSCGVCNGGCNSSCDCGWCGSVDDCDGNCNGTSVDDCGVCGGSGENYTCFDGSIACNAGECPPIAAGTWEGPYTSNGADCESLCPGGQYAQGDIWIAGPWPRTNCGGDDCPSGQMCSDGFRGTSSLFETLVFDYNTHTNSFPGACPQKAYPSAQTDYGADYVINDYCSIAIGYIGSDFFGHTDIHTCPPIRGGTIISSESFDGYLPWDAPGWYDDFPVMGTGCPGCWNYESGFDRFCCCGPNSIIQCDVYDVGRGGYIGVPHVNIPITSNTNMMH